MRSVARIATLIVLLVTWPTLAAPRPKAEAKPDEELKRMQGTWVYESQMIGGWSLPKEDLDKIWIEVEGDVLRLGGGTLQYKITLDPTTNPKSFDLVSYKHPSGKTFVQKGIYEWDGDVLRLCRDNTGKERPKEFQSPDGQENIALSVLKRKGK